MIGMHNACPLFRYNAMSCAFGCQDGSQMSAGLVPKPGISQRIDTKGARPFVWLVHLNLIVGAKQPGDKEKRPRFSVHF